jgi:hypothetical protein
MSYSHWAGEPPSGRSGVLRLSHEGRVVLQISLECHAMPLGDPFANIDVIILVEVDQINFLAVGDIIPENLEPFHSRITR